MELLEKWGFNIPPEIKNGSYRNATLTKLKKRVKDYKPGGSFPNIVVENVSVDDLMVLDGLVWELYTQKKLKSKISVINLGDLINAPFADQRDLESKISDDINLADFLILEDFDLDVDNARFRGKAHWVVRRRMFLNKPVILLLTGTEEVLDRLLGRVTVLRFEENAIKF